MSDIIVYRGKRVCRCVPPALEALEAELGHGVTITQGGYNEGGVAASAGTHDKGGVLDLATGGNDSDDLAMVKSGRTVGWSCWVRQPSEGPWNQHWHGVLNGCPHRAPLAIAQEASLREGRNGLMNKALDPHRSLGLPVVTYDEYMETDMPLSQADLDKIDALLDSKVNFIKDRYLSKILIGVDLINKNLWNAVVPRLDNIIKAVKAPVVVDVDEAALAATLRPIVEEAVRDAVGDQVGDEVIDELTDRLVQSRP